jgi:hypothetical protein
MSRMMRMLRASALVVTVLLGGCLFGGSLTVTNFAGIVSISVGGVDMGTCFADEAPPQTFLCAFPGEVASTFQTLTLAELLFRLVMLDPLVVQFPAGATNFAGSFLHTESGTSGPLEITAGLSSVRIDVNRQLVAEPGMQLVVIGLPAGAPTSGTFSFNFNFAPPPGATSLAVKPIITGLVELTDGSVFYPPILPCVTSMASAPAITIPLPVPGDTLTLPPLTNLGCAGAVYDYRGAAAPAAAVEVPALAPAMLIALASLIAGAGVAWLGRRRKP